MERLKRLRAEKRLSQARLAARAELDPSTVNQIERGAREASPATLRKLADALGVSLADLLEESPKAPAPSPETTPVTALPDAEGRVDYRQLYLEKRQEHIDLIKEIIDEASEVMGTEDYEEFIKLPPEEQHRRIDYAERLTNLAHERLKHFDDDDLPEELEHKVIHLRTTVEEFKKSA